MFSPNNFGSLSPHNVHLITLGLSVLAIFIPSHWVTQPSPLSPHYTGSLSPRNFHCIRLGETAIKTFTPSHLVTQPSRFHRNTLGHSVPATFIPSHWVTHRSRLSMHHTVSLSHHDFYSITLCHSDSFTLYYSPRDIHPVHTARLSSHHTVSLSSCDLHSITLCHSVLVNFTPSHCVTQTLLL